MKIKRIIIIFCLITILVCTLILKMYWLFVSIILIGGFIALFNSKLLLVSHIRKQRYLMLPITFTGIVIFAIWLRIFVFEIYSIPTGSMEDTLLPGDIIVVSKLNYGPVMPRSPLDIPWLNILFVLGKTDTAKSDSIWWQAYQAKGFSEIKNNDVVVFNHPSSENNKNVLIKRCVSLPGDTLLIVNGTVFINGKQLVNPQYSKNRYLIERSILPLAKDQFKEFELELWNNKNNSIELLLNSNQKEQILKKSSIDSIVRCNIYYDSAYMVYPYSNLFKWSIDNYGPIAFPPKEQTFIINNKNAAKYRNIICSIENVGFYTKDGNYFIDGSKIMSFKFSKNYYFMLGDNRQYSNDSRYFGPVPKENIIGKATLVLFNYHNGKFRWNRFLKKIK